YSDCRRLFSLLSFYSSGSRRYLPSFPTRRSSDLVFFSWLFLLAMSRRAAEVDPGPGGALLLALPSLKLPDIFEAFFLMCFSPVVDRKSTRLNSSHVKISYAVFCLKKKKKTKQQHQ